MSTQNWIILLVVVVAAGVAVWLFTGGDDGAAPATDAPAATEEAPATSG